MTKIGVISDTHNFLDSKVRLLFKGVEHILHAGDIGAPAIVHELERIAPVTAVLGNTDDAGMRFRETEVVELAGHKFLVHHIVDPRDLNDSLKRRFASERADAVVFGHTHKPFCATIEGTLFLNPGAAGKARFGLDRTLAILHVEDGKMRPEFVKL